MHDLLLDNQDALRPADLVRYAGSSGWTPTGSRTTCATHQARRRVARRRRQRRPERRLGHADVLHQRPPPLRAIRPRHAGEGGAARRREGPCAAGLTLGSWAPCRPEPGHSRSCRWPLWASTSCATGLPSGMRPIKRSPLRVTPILDRWRRFWPLGPRWSQRSSYSGSPAHLAEAFRFARRRACSRLPVRSRRCSSRSTPMQELLEGLLSTGHPDGLVGIFGEGGWWSVPIAIGSSAWRSRSPFAAPTQPSWRSPAVAAAGRQLSGLVTSPGREWSSCRRRPPLRRQLPVALRPWRSVSAERPRRRRGAEAKLTAMRPRRAARAASPERSVTYAIAKARRRAGGWRRGRGRGAVHRPERWLGIERG